MPRPRGNRSPWTLPLCSRWRSRFVRRGRVATKSAGHLRQRRCAEGHARMGDGPGRWRGVPQGAGAVRGASVRQRCRRQARHRRMTSTSALSARAGASKSSPRLTMTMTSSMWARSIRGRGALRPTWTARIRRGREAATTSATSMPLRRTRQRAADAKTAKPLRARAHLLVTVPLYMRFEPTGGRQ